MLPYVRCVSLIDFKDVPFSLSLGQFAVLSYSWTDFAHSAIKMTTRLRLFEYDNGNLFYISFVRTMREGLHARYPFFLCVYLGMLLKKSTLSEVNSVIAV